MKWALAVLILAATVFAGCGGGGDGSAGTAGPGVTPTSVAGVVAKGLVKGATVMVCRVVGGAPEQDAACARGVTGSDGAYGVSLADGFTGPVLVKIVAAAGSTMADETTGTDVPYAMTMRALVPAVTGATVVHVTPFSEMAVAGAMMSMPLDATKIAQSIAAVQGMMAGFAIDMGVVPVVDLKNHAADAAKLGDEANMVAQLARVAMAARHGGTLKDANGLPCNAAGATAPQQYACAVGAMAGVMSGYVTADPARLAAMVAALNAQRPTSVWVPVRRQDGSVVMQATDMTSFTSMQALMEHGGMSRTAAAGATNVMMGRMR